MLCKDEFEGVSGIAQGDLRGPTFREAQAGGPAPTDLDSEEWEVVAPKARKWAVKAEITGTGYRLVDDFMDSRFVFCELKLEAETGQAPFQSN